MASKMHAAVGLDNRQRDHSGQIRKKRGDTLVGTLRKEYGAGFAKGHRADMRLDSLLKKEGVESLHQLLRKSR